MKIVILDALTFGELSLSAFNELGDVDIYQTTSMDQTKERIATADVVVTNKVVITKDMMINASKLQLICIAATGMNNVDLKAANDLGIDVKNVAGYSTTSVIQHTFSMLFYLLGSSKYYDEVVKSGKYSQSSIFTDVSHPFYEVNSKCWGIIGLGSIGRGVANIASAFGANVCYYSTSGLNTTSDFKKVTLDYMFEYCDIITIHAPLNDQTQGLLSYVELSKCKKGTIILNLGRGGIIDENAIVKIIDERDDLRFGLDVLTKEPMVKDHPLLNIKNKDNIYITPHIAWTSIEARKKLINSVVENIKSLN